ncbi:hypothetical protein [Niabella aurantiaca]|uniref:hypothetical protein n=1 Tax=Niabella aurantiaca TaxID=379900 RepID=UPI0003A54B4B|nr:hypothetical protein [Niabella aurantiaca]
MFAHKNLPTDTPEPRVIADQKRTPVYRSAPRFDDLLPNPGRSVRCLLRSG